ncbi:hypothetical protein SDC9_113805 [bioreactor metagenome]|uniref:Uncharacterized protein n=1 Tax=bioreactor metagenome TaxID=1076179 RepID=A0A645BUH6_9ZZZZ
MLHSLRRVILIDLDHGVVAVSLGFQDLERFRRISRREYTIRDLALDDARRGRVANIAQRDKIAKRGHPVGPPRACIGAGNGRIVQPCDVVHRACDLVDLAQRQSDRRARRADVLKRRRRG